MKTLPRIIGFTRKYWLMLALAFVCLLATTAFSLVVPYVLSQAIDTAIEGGQRIALVIAAAIVVGASVLRGLFAYWNNYFSEIASQKTAYDLRNAMFDQLQRLSFAYHDKTQTGELMSRATADVEAIHNFIRGGLLGIIQTLMLFIGISYLLMVVDWRLALLTLTFLPFIAWRAIVVSKRLQRIWLRIQELLGVLGTTLEENLTGVRVVRAFSHEPEQSQKFRAEAKVLYDEERNTDRQMSFNIPLMVFFIGIPTALILWYGGRQVIAGSLTIGGLTRFILYLGMMGMPVRRLGYITNLMSRSISAGQRILEVLDTKPIVQEKPDAVPLDGVRGAVEFKNVSFSYNSTGSILQDVSFSVAPGQLVALVGDSGSGKSTIAHLIPRFYDVSSGSITIDGIDVRDTTMNSLRRNVGIVQQDIFLFSATIRDNIAYGAVDATMEQITTAAKAAHLHDFVMSLPDGYETWVGERGITLSGGEKQRLAIARTLLIDPRILILDDSTSSVDPETERLIRQALSRLIKGRTTFIITHRLPIIKNADLILVLKEGQVIERGKHEELMAQHGPYRHIYHAQFLDASESVAER